MEYFALSSNLSPICHVIIIRLYILLNIYLFIHIQYNIYDIFETKRKKKQAGVTYHSAPTIIIIIKITHVF